MFFFENDKEVELRMVRKGQLYMTERLFRQEKFLRPDLLGAI